MATRKSARKQLSAGYERRLKSTEGIKRATITVEQLAKKLGRNRVGVYDDLRAGRIPARRLGRRFIICEATIDAWLAGSDVVAA